MKNKTRENVWCASKYLIDTLCYENLKVITLLSRLRRVFST